MELTNRCFTGEREGCECVYKFMVECVFVHVVCVFVCVCVYVCVCVCLHTRIQAPVWMCAWVCDHVCVCVCVCVRACVHVCLYERSYCVFILSIDMTVSNNVVLIKQRVSLYSEERFMQTSKCYVASFNVKYSFIIQMIFFFFFSLKVPISLHMYQKIVQSKGKIQLSVTNF